ncbi:MAG: hypothetical protein HYX53_03705 [Chloroflexi bacterium]|nr:hypothetical protein [Chloroflexota bacterium]
MPEEREPVPVPDFSGSSPAVRRVPVDPPPAASSVPECDCPRLEAEDWDGVESDWSDITFLRTSSSAVLGVPIGYGTTRDALAEKAAAIGATVPADAMILLGSGRFRRPVLLEIENAPAHAKDVYRPGGIAYTRLIPAPWGQMHRVVEETKQQAKEKYGRAPDDTWVWYLTCRTCSTAREFETLILAHFRDRK